MPRYFFDLVAGPLSFTDTVGSELHGVEAVQNDAVAFLMERARNQGWKAVDHDVECLVREGTGRVVFKLTLRLTAKIVSDV